MTGELECTSNFRSKAWTKSGVSQISIPGDAPSWAVKTVIQEPSSESEPSLSPESELSESEFDGTYID